VFHQAVAGRSICLVESKTRPLVIITRKGKEKKSLSRCRGRRGSAISVSGGGPLGLPFLITRRKKAACEYASFKTQEKKEEKFPILLSEKGAGTISAPKGMANFLADGERENPLASSKKQEKGKKKNSNPPLPIWLQKGVRRSFILWMRGRRATMIFTEGGGKEKGAPQARKRKTRGFLRERGTRRFSKDVSSLRGIPLTDNRLYWGEGATGFIGNGGLPR